MILPGYTDLSSYTKLNATLTELSPNTERKIIILATNDANDESLFKNGLTQNILILYDLFETLGYVSYLLKSQENATSSKKAFISNYKTIHPTDIIRNPIPIHTFIEIGMSVDSVLRSYLRSIGAKIVKLYLGNILNIDIETIQNYKDMFFYHHITGEIDEIWTSPHYKQHIDYAAVLNRTEIANSKIVPYVWDSCFISRYGNKDTLEWIPPLDWRLQNIVICDPNISFQKSFLYSLLLIEAYSKLYTEWKGNIHIINGDKIRINDYSYNSVISMMSLHKQDRIIYHSRKNIHTIINENRSACFITHQLNNDFNYMTLELMYCNFPILHNSHGWDNVGYYYTIDKWDNAIKTLHNALTMHTQNLNIYKLHSSNLIWRHSIYNPNIQSEWRSILE